jgi:hypothetical protein
MSQEDKRKIDEFDFAICAFLDQLNSLCAGKVLTGLNIEGSVNLDIKQTGACQVRVLIRPESWNCGQLSVRFERHGSSPWHAFAGMLRIPGGDLDCELDLPGGDLDIEFTCTRQVSGVYTFTGRTENDERVIQSFKPLSQCR